MRPAFVSIAGLLIVGGFFAAFGWPGVIGFTAGAFLMEWSARLESGAWRS